MAYHTIGHQTLEDRDNADYVEGNGPFQADRPDPYLGRGYYFWEDNCAMAEYWGETQKRGNYIICKSNIFLDDNLHFDLMGNRQHQKLLLSLKEKFERKDWPIGKFIEFLKELSKKKNCEKIFPFKIIRAMDSARHDIDEIKEYFNKRNKGYANLNPIVIICLTEKNSLFLHSYKIIHPEKYVQD
jgi:hypothetical protein